MMACHAIVLVLDITSKSLQTMVCYGAYLKGGMHVLRGIVYFIGLGMVSYKYVKLREERKDYAEGWWPWEDYNQDVYEHCYLLPANDYPLYKVKQYRELEIGILFLQILAQAIYLLLAKLLIFVRERYCSYS